MDILPPSLPLSQLSAVASTCPGLLQGPLCAGIYVRYASCDFTLAGLVSLHSTDLAHSFVFLYNYQKFFRTRLIKIVISKCRVLWHIDYK